MFLYLEKCRVIGFLRGLYTRERWINVIEEYMSIRGGKEDGGVSPFIGID